jgi:hypothetical protein
VRAASKAPKLVVVDLPGDATYQGSLIKAVNSIIAKDLRDQGFDVITPADIGAALGLDKERQLMGCSEDGCLAEIGGALGADYIVHGELASMSKDTLFTLTLTDKAGHAVNQVGGIVKGKEAENLVEAVDLDVPKLVKPLRDAGKLGPAPAAPASADAAVTQSTPQAAPSPSHLPSYLLIGGGAVLLAGSLGLGLVANGNFNTIKSDVQSGTPPGNLRSTETWQAWTSTGLMAGGVIAAGVGVALLFLGSSAPAAMAAPSPGGAVVSWNF